MLTHTCALQRSCWHAAASAQLHGALSTYVLACVRPHPCRSLNPPILLPCWLPLPVCLPAVLCLPHAELTAQLPGNDKPSSIEVLPRSKCLAPWDALLRTVSDNLTFVHVAYMVYWLVNGVCFLHLLGYVHRDLKAGNVMVQMYSASDTVAGSDPQHRAAPRSTAQVFLPKIVEFGMAEELQPGSPVEATHGTVGWRLMDTVPIARGSTHPTCVEQDQVAVAQLSLALMTSPSGPKSGPPTVDELRQSTATGALELQEVPAHTLLGDLKRLAASIPGHLQPTNQSEVAVWFQIMQMVQQLLEQYPIPGRGQERDAGHHTGVTDPDSSTGPEAAFVPASVGTPAHQRLSTMRDQLAGLLSTLTGPVAELHTRIQDSMATSSWAAVAAGTGEAAAAVCHKA